MLKKSYLMIFALTVLVFSISESEAGCNGSCSYVEEGDWVINQDTHVWDEEVSVKNIIVNLGSGLKLENVTLTSIGSIVINEDSEWINSTIYHDKESLDDNISLYKQLELVNTNLTMNATDVYDGANANVFFVSREAQLVVRDFDGDRETEEDRSIIRGDNSHVTNLSLVDSHSVIIGGCVTSSCSNDVGDIDISNINIENSFLENIYALRIYGNDTYIRNNTIDNSGFIVSTGDSTIFSNNTITNSWTFWDLVIPYGDNALISDNLLSDGYAGFGIFRSENSLIKNNICDNYDGYCLRLDNSNNTLVTENVFSNKSTYASLIIDESNSNMIESNIFFNTSGGDDTIRINGNFNTIKDNYFEKCGYTGNWYNTCIELCPYCLGNTEVILMNNITGNTFVNSSSAATLLSNVEYSNVSGNVVIGPEISRSNLAGFFPMRYPATSEGNYTKAPSNNTFENNLIENVGIGISFDFYGQAFGPAGYGNVVRNNTINNVDIGIQIWALYENMTIENNTINSTDYGSSFFDSAGKAGIYLKAFSTTPTLVNFTIVNNTISSVKGIGIIADYTEGLIIKNNHITTFSGLDGAGNGIICKQAWDAILEENIIITNITKDSAAAGIFIYLGQEILIANNSIKASVGMEISSYEQATEYINIIHNTVETVNYGIISNRSYSMLTDNNIIGICDYSSCDVVNFNEVSKYGIFSQESTMIIRNNNLHNFYEFFASYISDYNLTNNTFNYGHIGIKSNNSEGSLYTNNFTNITTINFLYKSELDMLENYYSNFDTGIYSFNSTVNFHKNTITDGELCAEFIDSDYNELENILNCRNNNIIVSYTVAIRIANENDEGSYNHPFQIYDSEGNLIIEGNTRINGNTGYYILEVYKLTSEGVSREFNPFKLHYSNNDVLVIYERNITYNQTILGLLDTTAPVSVLSGTGNLVNNNNIMLNVEIMIDGGFKEYNLEYLENEKFSEWQVYGTFTENNITFFAESGKEYRFRSSAIDIYGNIEEKTGYEYQVTVDTSVPKTELLNLEEEYYFAGKPYVKLSWTTDSDDISQTHLDIYYTNFTTPYLNVNSVTWAKIDAFIVYDNEEFYYNLSSKGHYAFIIKSKDYAGNEELKDDFDVIFNYNSKLDTLNFGEIPSRWGEDSLTIDYTTSSFNLDFDLFIALESISNSNTFLTWYSYDYVPESNTITLRGLQDDTRYYVYAISRDLAGNTENPLNTTSYYSSNGLYDQEFNLKYIPLLDWDYNLVVEIDNDLDGDYDTVLDRGTDLDRLKENEYYLNLDDNTIIFGGLSNGGFVPNEDIDNINNIRVSYAGVQGIFEVYTGQPESANSINIIPTNTTELVITFMIPKDAPTCKVQSTTNVSKGFYNQQIFEPCDAGLKEYIHTNPDLDQQYYYRIMIIDEFGHESFSENRSVDMKDIVKLYTSNENADTGLLGMDSIIPITALVGIIMLGFGGVLLYRSKNEEVLEENVNLIESKPVAKYKVEELYLIYKDGRLIKNLSDVEVKTDSDIMSGMLTAINDFVQDSFNTEGDLGSIDYGNNKIVLQRGAHSYLAAVIYGETGNQFKGKMFRSVAEIEKINQTMAAWNGDAETILHTEHYLQPIIDETVQVTREMVDNYFTEKEIIMTSTSEKINDTVKMNINISNYSNESINNCKINPNYNDGILSLKGIEPDISYSFADNNFSVGEIKPYNEIQFIIYMKLKVATKSVAEIKMTYEQRGRDGEITSAIQID